jgi:hypothetical protein
MKTLILILTSTLLVACVSVTDRECSGVKLPVIIIAEQPNTDTYWGSIIFKDSRDSLIALSLKCQTAAALSASYNVGDTIK